MNNAVTADPLIWKEINKIENLQSIKNDWIKLFQTAPDRTIFLSYEWILNWSNIYWQKNWQLKVLIAYEHGTPVLIAPFYIQKPKRNYHTTKFYFLGQGEPEEEELMSEYCDLLVAPYVQDYWYDELTKKIKNANVDQFILKATLTNSHIQRVLNRLNYKSNIKSYTRYIIDCDKWDFLKLSKNTRSRYKRSQNQLRKIEAKFSWVPEENYENHLIVLAKFHQKRWGNKGKKGAFSHPNFIKFHHRLRKINNAASLKISAIVINGNPVAINYYLSDEHTLHFYQCGWDEANYSNFSLGLALHLWSIEQCSFKYYDFMMGGVNNSYKAKFGCQEVPMISNIVVINKWKFNLEQLINLSLKYCNRLNRQLKLLRNK
ncbi:MAG: GNAT family N-acetyltransferase [Cognaticolwellia sp.]